MAGETSAELTIVVRAQDAATRVIKNIGATVVRAITTPIKLAAKSVLDLGKQFFGLKALLVGGGVIVAIKTLATSLATAQDKYAPLFSASTQAKINATASAFNKFGASIQSVFGELLADFDIEGKLNALSDWLRDNKTEIVAFFRDVGRIARDLAAMISSLADGSTSFGKLIGFKGTNLLGVPKFNAEAGAAERTSVVAQAEIWRRATSLAGTPSVAKEIAGESYDALMKAFVAAVRQGGTEASPTIIEQIVGTDKVGNLERVGRDIARINAAWAGAGDVTKRVAEAMAAGFGADGERGAIAAGLRAAADEAEKFKDSLSDAAPIVMKVAEETEKVAETSTKVAASLGDVAEKAKEAATEVGKLTPIIEGYLEVGEFADLAAGTLTDSFEAVIRGTQKVGQAFASMVATIIGELGRLLLYRSLLNLITSAFSVGSSLGGLSSIPGSTSSGAVTPDFDFPQLARASGGPVRRSGFVTVGENGPERVALPAGSHVSPSQRSGMGGGDTINVYGARDARATAREVAAEMRRNRVLRRSLA